MMFRTPVSLLQLTYQKSRLFATIVGITFAIFLMFIQLGFRDGLFEDTVTLHKAIQADLVLIHSNTENIFTMTPFSRRRLYNVSAIKGVKSVSPYYFGTGNWKNPETFISKRIAICAFTPDRPIFKSPEINQQLEVIKQENTVLFDRLSQPEYGQIVANFQEKGALTTELSNQKINISGLFSLGGGVMSTSTDGLIITSDSNFFKLLNAPPEAVYMGVIKLEPSVDPDSMVSQISPSLPQDVKLLTMTQFMKLQKDTIAESTPIGFIFNLGTAIGCVFGGTVVYQIFYTQISDSLPIYATLKAIGYAHSYLVGIVLKQALLLSVMSYIPGFVFCLYLYSIVQNATRLPMFMTFDRALLVLLMTFIMCAIASLLAMGKLRSADPAELFR